MVYYDEYCNDNYCYLGDGDCDSKGDISLLAKRGDICLPF